MTKHEATAMVSIQMIPRTKADEDYIPYVDRAIEIIQQSGVRYMVNPMETTMEGELSHLLDIVRRMHEEMLAMGAVGAMSNVKISCRPEGVSMDRLVEKFRP